jgi:SAM-dependent methyltransferase
LKFNPDIFSEYVIRAPLALALERILECRIYSALPFERPILDIGCGDGVHASVLFAEKIDTGVDPDMRELEQARRSGAYCEVIACQGDGVPKADGSYRTIFSNSVLEHIPEVSPVFEEAYRLLAPGGRFYFTAPSPNFERFTVINLTLEALGLNGLSKRFRKFFNLFWAHHHAYPIEVWAKLGQDAGFELSDAYTFAPAGTCVLNTVLTPFAISAKITKKISGRWSVCPQLRRAILSRPASLAAPILQGGRAPGGGLVFVSLRKV